MNITIPSATKAIRLIAIVVTKSEKAEVFHTNILEVLGLNIFQVS